jgi:ankyrin repeat protein
MHAAGGGFVGIIELLVDAGAALSAADEFGLTALHYAAESGQVGAIRALLARGADVHAADETGKRAVDVAHAWGFPEAARALGATASELAAFAAATTEDASAGEDQDVQPSPNTGSSALNPEKLEL